jgi:hypothetical protein
MRLTFAEDLSLDHDPCLACGLCRLLNYLVELGGEGVRDPGQHDVVQSSPIDGRIRDIRGDMVIEGIVTKCEKHEVMPLLVVRQ